MARAAGEASDPNRATVVALKCPGAVMVMKLRDAPKIEAVFIAIAAAINAP